jgi:hypothetical protein
VSPAAWKAVASALERFGRAETRRRRGGAERGRRLRRAA